MEKHLKEIFKIETRACMDSFFECAKKRIHTAGTIPTVSLMAHTAKHFFTISGSNH